MTGQRKIIMDNRPIGVFDSGVGGLTVVKEILKELPKEDIVYFGDTARVPYGSKSRATVLKFSIENTIILLHHNVKMIVVACNTSSSVSLEILKKNFRVPIIGVIEPGAKQAVRLTKNNRIGVIGTKGTISSGAYEKEIHRLNKRIKVSSASCPLFVPLVEEGWNQTQIAKEIAKIYLSPLKKSDIDTLILGCTHYPLLKNQIAKVLKGVRLVDSARALAAQVRGILDASNIACSGNKKQDLQVYVSDEPESFARIGEKFLGRCIRSVKKVQVNV